MASRWKQWNYDEDGDCSNDNQGNFMEEVMTN